jgi:hypothetical protein
MSLFESELRRISELEEIDGLRDHLWEMSIYLLEHYGEGQSRFITGIRSSYRRVSNLGNPLLANYARDVESPIRMAAGRKLAVGMSVVRPDIPWMVIFSSQKRNPRKSQWIRVQTSGWDNLVIMDRWVYYFEDSGLGESFLEREIVGREGDRYVNPQIASIGLLKKGCQLVKHIYDFYPEVPVFDPASFEQK